MRVRMSHSRTWGFWNARPLLSYWLLCLIHDDGSSWSLAVKLVKLHPFSLCQSCAGVAQKVGLSLAASSCIFQKWKAPFRSAPSCLSIFAAITIPWVKDSSVWKENTVKSLHFGMKLFHNAHFCLQKVVRLRFKPSSLPSNTEVVPSNQNPIQAPSPAGTMQVPSLGNISVARISLKPTALVKQNQNGSMQRTTFPKQNMTEFTTCHRVGLGV